MKNKKTIDLVLVSFLTVLLMLIACEDERVLPVTPPADSYTETITLLEDATANGQDLRGTFTLLDEVEDGFITVACFLQPDGALNYFDQIGEEIEDLNQENEDIDLEIINIELQEVLTPEDSLRLDSLRAVKAENEIEVGLSEVLQDSLDTWLDDRFKLSVWMNNDTVEYYPGAIFLDSTSLNADGVPMNYLEDQSIVWGQGFYLAPFDSVSGWRGMTIRLDLDEFWVADGGWDLVEGAFHHHAKPERAVSYTNQYPIREWLDRMTPAGSHTIHFRFGAAGLSTKVTASLYVVYKTAVRR